MQQVASLTVGAFVGSKLAWKYMPRVRGKKYSTAYISGHRTLAYSVPWAVSCYWFETPALLTQVDTPFTYLSKSSISVCLCWGKNNCIMGIVGGLAAILLDWVLHSLCDTILYSLCRLDNFIAWCFWNQRRSFLCVFHSTSRKQ